jgi:hypothetical protein
MFVLRSERTEKRMLSEKLKAEIARATVKITRKGGQGVLVGSNLIVTAALIQVKTYPG